MGQIWWSSGLADHLESIPNAGHRLAPFGGVGSIEGRAEQSGLAASENSRTILLPIRRKTLETDWVPWPQNDDYHSRSGGLRP